MWNKRDWVKAWMGRKGVMMTILWWLGVIFAILGVIADARRSTLGLQASSWFGLAAVVVLLAIAEAIIWAVTWYLTEHK